jgi:hypothetical protein
MTYGDYLTTSEMTRWILDTDIPWNDIDPALALSQPDVLDRVRASALIESFFPIFTPRALDLLWDNITATAIYSIQLYESYKHFHVFAQYPKPSTIGRSRRTSWLNFADAILGSATTIRRGCSRAI